MKEEKATPTKSPQSRVIPVPQTLEHLSSYSDLLKHLQHSLSNLNTESSTVKTASTEERDSFTHPK